MLKNYPDLSFDVLHFANPDNRYADGDYERLVNLYPIALSSNYELTNSSREQLENISHAHVVSLMYELITSSKDSDDLSFGFDRCRDRRQRELTNRRRTKGKNHLKIYLRDIFDYSEYQEKATISLGYKLTLTRNSDSVVLKKGNGINEAKSVFNSTELYVPRYTPSISRKTTFPEQNLSKAPTKLQY